MKKENLPYSKKIMEHFLHPHNMGEIKNPDGVGKVGNPYCGDVMWLYIKVKKDKKTGEEKISEIKFKTFGCVTAIASSSIITDLAKDKTLKEVLEISSRDVVKSLGGKLPPIKIHCSVLAADALAEAIYDYLKKRKRKIPKKLEEVHKRIQKSLKQAEKMHKEYMRFEEEMMKNGST